MDVSDRTASGNEPRRNSSNFIRFASALSHVIQLYRLVLASNDEENQQKRTIQAL